MDENVVKQNDDLVHTKPKKQKKKSKLFIMFIVIDLLFIIFLFFTYGPISYFREILITTAKNTMTHQYLAYIFYSEKTVDKVMDSNYIVEFTEDTDTNQIIIKDNTQITEYESSYEEQILKKNPGNDLYKIIDIKGEKYAGKIAVIYDPKRVKYVESKKIRYGGQIMENLAKDSEALVAINASGFTVTSNGLVQNGAVIIDGKIVKDTNYGNIIGLNPEGVLMLKHCSASQAVAEGIVFGMEFGPFLIVNGESAITKGTSAGGIAPRTAIAQRKDGIILFMTIDGRRVGHSIGATYNDMIDVLEKYGAYNAANLDGGGSSSMVVEGEMINEPGGSGYDGARYLPDAWILK